MEGFRRSLAVVVGIDGYGDGIPQLRTAVNDARRVADILGKEHGFEVILLTEQEASLAALRELFAVRLPAEVGADDRLLVYFAGHGIALDGDEGPAGYLIPHDAGRDDPASYLPMREAHEALAGLTTRHLLVILDCCFAGAFRWGLFRHAAVAGKRMYRERYARFVRDSAWQVITSSAYDQYALDVFAGIGDRGAVGDHSPFALELFKGLSGGADFGVSGADGVVTATELYWYLRDKIEPLTANKQTPGLWQLPKHGKGEFIFHVPGREIELPPAPPLDEANNPYRGLQPFDEQHKDLFFGRRKLVEQLHAAVLDQPLTVVLGASGTGKSSVVRAGLLPRLRDEGHLVLGPVRPGAAPLDALASLAPAGTKVPGLNAAVGALREANPGKEIVVVVDQIEELVTLSGETAREKFLEQLALALRAHEGALHLVVTLRSDFEPQFSADSGGLEAYWTPPSRFVVPPMTQDELREAIEGPAAVRVLYFEPPALVDRLINEVVQTPGALPLLSFTLSELYLRYVGRAGEDRSLTEADYDTLGGVAGSLRSRADEEYRRLDAAHQQTMRRVLLRMVSFEGGERARRRVPRAELEYADPAENARVAAIVEQLVAARLLVEGRDDAGIAYVEPAHDALVLGWDRLWRWTREEEETLPLQRRVAQAALDWEARGRRTGLWHADPRLPQLDAVRRSPGNWLNRLESEFVARSSRWRQLRRGLAGAVVLLVALVATVAVLGWNQAEDRRIEVAQQRDEAERQRSRAEELRAEADRERLEAERQRNEAERQRNEAGAQRDLAQERARIALSRQLAAQATSLLDDQQTLSLLVSMEALRARDSVEARTSLLAGLQLYPFLHTVLSGHEWGVNALDYSPDGRMLASGGDDGLVILWDTATGQPLSEPFLHSDGWVRSVAFSPDGRMVASGGSDRTVVLWDVAAHQSIAVLEQGAPVGELSWRGDGKVLAAGDDQGRIVLWDVPAHRRLGAPLNAHPEPISGLSFSPDGKALASLAYQPLLWDLSGSRPVSRPISVPGGRFLTLSFSPDGKTIALGGCQEQMVIGNNAFACRVGRLALWDVAGRRARGQPLFAHEDWITRLDFSPDGKMLASGGDDGSLALWDMAGPKLVIMMRGHTSFIQTLSFGPGGRIASGAEKVMIWDATRRSLVGRQIGVQGSGVDQVAFSPDGSLLATGGVDDTITLWDAHTEREVGRLQLEPEAFTRALTFSPDGALLASSGLTDEVFLWDVAGRTLKAELPLGELLAAGSLAFSPDGRVVAAGSSDNLIILWDVATGRRLGEPLRGHDGTVPVLAFTPDGKGLISAGFDNKLKLWDLSTRTARDFTPREPPTDVDAIVGLAVSPDGKTLITSHSFHLIVWDIATLAQSGPTLRAWKETNFNSVAISHDGRWFATGDSGGQITLWELASRARLGTGFAGHSGNVLSVAFSPGGKTIASGSTDDTIWLWDVGLDAWQNEACKLANRNMTHEEWEQYLGLEEPYRQTCADLPAAAGD